MNKCPKCGSSKLQTKPLRRRYHYTESGLDNVWIHDGVMEAVCPSCKSRLISIGNEPQLLQVIAMALLVRPGFLASRELRYLRQACELTQEALAKLLGLSRRATVGEWESEERPRRDPGSELLLRLVLLHAFKEMLEVDGNCHLSPSHLDTLRTFEEGFSRAFQELLKQRPVRRLEVEKPQNQPWRTPGLLSCY